jgi:photosystem II stability/assembly factor-like uncharacterized protein
MGKVDEYFSANDGAAFAQYIPGQEPLFLGNCFTADALPDPSGDVTPIFCFNEDRKFEAIGEELSAPGAITTTLTGLQAGPAGTLDTLKTEGCPFWFYITQHKCGKKGVFGNWERVWAIERTRITDDALTNAMVRDSSTKTERAFSLTAWPPRVDSWEITVGLQDVATAADANCIATCQSSCAGDCGDRISPCEVLVIGTDGGTAATADVLRSADSGATWAALAADPFAIAENIVSIACFELDKNTTRILCIRDTDAATALEYGYSDDTGATWTNGTIGATLAEAGVGQQSMFVLDPTHIWVCTDDGRVFFSADFGVTWTDQDTALTASGANALNAIHFVTANVGFAVGATDTVIYTTNGGTTWTAGTATGGGDNLLTVRCFNANRVIVGTSGGDIYITFDGSTNWALRPFTGSTVGAVNCLDFASDLNGFMVHDTAAPLGGVFRTVNGGWTWEAMTTPTNQGLNAVVACHNNRAHGCGETVAAGEPAIFLAA